MPRTIRPALAAISVLVLLTGCAGGPEPTPTGSPAPAASTTTDASPPTTPWAYDGGTISSLGTPSDLATGLAAPWSVAPLPDGGALVSERDTARILRWHPDGHVSELATVAGVDAGGEGGLMGLALHAHEGQLTGDAALYAMFTAAADNRVVRFPLGTEGDELRLGTPEVILEGLPRASNHNGGRIAIGPDDLLYVTAGDAGVPANAQDPGSLGGKILRIGLDGSVPSDNPFGTAVYSMGHRNPQGLAWDGPGQLWASEFGQDTWDELNRIEPGANYGWPTVEGQVGAEGFVDPVAQWPTNDASPSGLTWARGSFFMAALRGRTLWQITIGPDGQATATPWLADSLGRLRDVVPGGEGQLWVLTNNTDGRGSPNDGDDRLVSVPAT
ncbi:PQQ-dependent sugar dehydrogenase [Pseudoclavibacter chungangensis]|uniref:PQQ-dependent sugar dehydrogenase n=1 Tax=Pseudoclavibacter chungangensis TaxID=587635 RepID=A0A7J5BZ14_9MICO|nr:PQQ-dependent sugar dehydrogenase [Pseudoclavibacter chungangensis]KAB1659598.1 PQQ-dependent sugar dehydrogenase [Pseudoclavibacter chungangensis]NYJ67421.1 glucose/arabinose dehydrogenase [Pseudoclavibacter chungangensis]